MVILGADILFDGQNHAFNTLSTLPIKNMGCGIDEIVAERSRQVRRERPNRVFPPVPESAYDVHITVQLPDVQ